MATNSRAIKIQMMSVAKLPNLELCDYYRPFPGRI